MNHIAIRHGLAILAAAFLLSGCTLLPATNKDLATTGPTYQSSAGACGETWDKAKRCANFLIEQYTNVDADVGKIDSAFGFTNLAAGTLGAIYLKSAKDRTQALEDLGVTVGALAGLRGFLAVEDKRKIVRTGVTAVQCMLDAAQATIDKADNGGGAFRMSGFQPIVRFTLRSGNTTTSPSDVIFSDLQSAGVPAPAQVAFGVLFNDRVNALTNAWVSSGNAARTAAGNNCTPASTDCAAATKLGAGLARIVSDVRLAWNKPVEGIDKLHETQRALVDEQIGALVKAAQDQHQEQQKLAGAAAMVPFALDTNGFVQALEAAAPDPAADAQLLSVYNKCVTPTPPPAS